MKKHFLALASLLFLLVSCNQKSAVEYNDLCINNVSKIILQYNKYNEHVDSDSLNFDTLETLRAEGMAIAKNSIEVLNNTPAFENETRLKATALMVSQTYYQMFNVIFKKDLELAKNIDNAKPEELMANNEAIDKESQKISIQTKELEIAQKEFCTKHNIRIDSNNEK